jgi:hypothetical protein
MQKIIVIIFILLCGTSYGFCQDALVILQDGTVEIERALSVGGDIVLGTQSEIMDADGDTTVSLREVDFHDIFFPWLVHTGALYKLHKYVTLLQHSLSR